MSTTAGKKIVVAVDGSETARDALRVALQLAPALGCSLVALTTIQTRLPGYRAAYFSFVDRHILMELRQFAESVLEEARAIAGQMESKPLETVALEGEKDIFEQIADYVGAMPEMAFLVMGSYGHGVRERLILGSTTQRLILEISRRGLKTPVLVVP